MDFLDPKKKRSYTTRLYVGYVLMAVLISISALILLYAAFGYGVNKQGDVIQNGLVFLASDPGSAEVTVTNKSDDFSKKVATPKRLVLAQGSYNFKIQKEGYYSWSKSVEVKGGKIERLDYPFLFPQKLSSKILREYNGDPSVLSVSPGRNRLIAGKPNDIKSFDSIEINKKDRPATIIQFPASLFNGVKNNSSLKVLEWSADNRHILASYDSTSGKNYLLLDFDNPSKSTNLNRFFGKKITDVKLRDKKADQLYIKIKKNLYLVKLPAKKLSKVAGKVLEFNPFKSDRIVLVTETSTNNKSVELRMWHQDKGAFVIKQLPQAKKYLIDIAEYDNNLYVAGASSNSKEAYVYKNPVDNAEKQNDATFTTRTLRLDSPEKLTFSANARFISVQSSSKFVVYDAYDDRQFHFNLSKYPKISLARWMDGHRIVTNEGTKTLVFDFDGKNIVNLLSSSGHYYPAFNSSYDSIFIISKPDKNGTRQLVDYSLIVKNN